MNKKSIVSVVAIFILSMLLGFVIHAAWLHPDYQALPNLFRADADAQNYFVFMLIAHVFMAIGYTFLYRRFRTAGGSLVQQGLSFGFLLVLAFTIPMYLIYYAVQPTPLDLVIKQIVGDTLGNLVIGVALAYLNK